MKEYKEIKEDYKQYLEEHWNKYPNDISYFLTGTASAIALEPCYTAAQRGNRIKALFQAWEELKQGRLL